uniref:NADH-ubiquinone oxidoreductase chain 4 n=1 Tax=Trioza erytreae TaxID=1778831 RepID=A0A6M8YAC4_TRIEB|nr:NADH dehydrogenase subunit 4 [Trioza erytreae]QKK36459.1 NADH dehydrogenase subunit 4 [Trioza erytreae]
MLEVLMGSLFIVVLSSWLLNMNCLVMFFMILMFKFYDNGEYNIKLIMFLLSIWLVIMMMMSVEFNLKTYDLLLVFIMLLISLFLTFYSETMFIFYLGFEMSVIPVLLIIYGWGYQPDRLDAGFYMMLYTVFFSLPLLLGIFYFENLQNWSIIVVCLYLMAFLVKLPMFGLHFWLPRAHVEAPVFGSMILAGVMLKLGGYGIMKISLLKGDYIYLNVQMIITMSILGGLWLSWKCFIQSDMKMLVAYSSVVHMSLVLAGLLTFREMALAGTMYMMIGHGLCSSGLFCVLGLTYNRTLTRSIYLNKGILSLMPICSMWWFFFCSSNLSFPPCLNLFGEILLFTSILSWNIHMYMIMLMMGVFSSMYSIYLYAFTQQGQMSNFFCFKNFNLNESLLMMLHWLPLNYLMLDLLLMILY